MKKNLMNKILKKIAELLNKNEQTMKDFNNLK